MVSSIVGVIPVRYAATRFPGKALTPILGKPMLQWVLEGVAKCSQFNQILVATDHEEIAALAKKLGHQPVMTDSELPSGSDRVWAAVRNVECDMVVNIQGDEPLINGEVLQSLVSCMKNSEEQTQMWTLADELPEAAVEARQAVKVLLDKDDHAIYFSRWPIPFSRQEWAEGTAVPCYKHIGIYGYRKSFLKSFCEAEPSAIELAEGLEQLRALHLGAKIRVERVEYKSWGVDLPGDVEKVEAILKGRGYESQ